MGTFITTVPANPYEQTTTGGTISTNEYQPETIKFMKELEPRETPILTKIMSNEEVRAHKHEWGQSFLIPMETRLNGALNSSATAIPVATGTGYYFQKWMTATIVDVKAGTTDVPDWSTAERIWCSADPTADGITVGTRGSFGTAAASHADGALVFLTGTAEPYNASHSEAPRQRGLKYYNYPQRFGAKLTADRAAQNTPSYENPTNVLLLDHAKELVKQKKYLEFSFWQGRRNKGDGSQTNPSMMGGIETFLTTNNFDLGGELLTPGTLDDIFREIAKNTTTQPGQLQFFGGFDEVAILDTQINPIRRADIGSKEYTNFINKYNFRTGSIDVTPTRDVPRGKIFLLDLSKVKIKPYAGCNWHVSGQKGDDFAVDHDVKAISGDFTLEVQGEASMAVFSNFNTDLDQYTTTVGRW